MKFSFCRQVLFYCKNIKCPRSWQLSAKWYLFLLVNFKFWELFLFVLYRVKKFSFIFFIYFFLMDKSKKIVNLQNTISHSPSQINGGCDAKNIWIEYNKNKKKRFVSIVFSFYFFFFFLFYSLYFIERAQSRFNIFKSYQNVELFFISFFLVYFYLLLEIF